MYLRTLSFILSLLCTAQAAGDIIDVVASADGDAFTIGSSNVFLNTDQSTIRTLTVSVVDQRGLFEFDVSGLAGNTIESAQLKLMTASTLNRGGNLSNLTVNFLAYIGNGTIEADDYARGAQLVGSIDLLETSAGGPAAGSVISVDLDAGFLQQILDSGGIIGIRSQQVFASSRMDVYSLDSTALLVPTLSLGLSAVPEPGSGVLVFLASLGLLFRRGPRTSAFGPNL